MRVVKWNMGEGKMGRKQKTRTGTKIKRVRKIFIRFFYSDFQCGISAYVFLIICYLFSFQDRPVYKNVLFFFHAFLHSVFSSQKSSTDVQVLPCNLLDAVRTASPSPAFVCVCVCVCVDFQLSIIGV